MKKTLTYISLILILLLASCKSENNKNRPHGMLTDAPVDSATEILLPDANGTEHSVEQLRGNVVIMDVLLETPSDGDRHMARLRTIYDRYHTQGLEIYQVCLDTMPDRWRTVAKTLPWVAVYDNRSLQSSLLEKYRVMNIPSTQLFNRDGTRSAKSLDDIDTFFK